MRSTKINQHQKSFKEASEKSQTVLGKRPDWLKVKLPSGEYYAEVLNLMRKKSKEKLSNKSSEN